MDMFNNDKAWRLCIRIALSDYRSSLACEPVPGWPWKCYLHKYTVKCKLTTASGAGIIAMTQWSVVVSYLKLPLTAAATLRYGLCSVS